MSIETFPKRTLAVIPARGGSKGVPNKNIKLLAGKPLIAYSIEQALKAKGLNDVVVSTDSEEIAKIARDLGALVPFIRPAELSTDMATSLPVIKHAVEFMEKQNNWTYDAIIMLQPTCPLRMATDIEFAIQKLFSTNADSVISVVDVEGHHPFRMKRIVGEDRLINFIDQGFEDMRPRQVLPPVYIRSGSIYLAKRKVIMEENTFVGADCRAIIMAPEKSVNIDNIRDFIIAEQYILEKGLN
jgi:CMP-N,N'-diacetyllegionaminic acid synthase